MDLQKEIERLQKYGMTQYVSVAIQKANDAKLISEAQLAYDLYSFRMNEQEKLNAKTKIEGLRIQKSREYNAEEKKSRLRALKEQYDYETNLINLAAEQRKRAYEQTYSNSLRDIQQARALLAAPKGEREGLSTQFGESNAMSDNDNALLNEQDNLKAKLAKGEILTLEYNKRIEDAVRLHEETKHKIQEEYAQKYQDLQKGQYESQLQIWSSLLNQGQSVWSNLTQSVKDASGEQSKRYKAMFAMQQAFAIASTIVSAHLAAAETTADITLPFVGKIPAASAILGFGYAQAAMIAAQTIAGFANGGQIRGAGTNTSDSIPIMASHEEFMIKAKSAKKIGLDNLNYMNRTGELPNREMNQYNAINSNPTTGSATVLEPIVNVYVLEGQTADVTRNDDGSLDVRIRQIAGEVAEKVFLQGIQNPNSRISKAFKQNYNATPRRQ